MKLFVSRHGHSLSTAEAGVASDAKRPLSDTGRSDVRRMAEFAASQGAAPELILTSPLRRAIETGGEATKVLKPKLGTKIFQPLANEISGKELFQALLHQTVDQKALNTLQQLWIVGHQPQLGDMVLQITGGVVELRPGGIVALNVEDGKAALLWSRNP